MPGCVNGHEWAKRQAEKKGIVFTALDNGFATVEDPARMQALCDELGPAQIQALLDKWLAVLPGAFTDTDRDAGYRYELSILQAEFSLTQMLDRPVSGRVFFEHARPQQPRRWPPGPGWPGLRPTHQVQRPPPHAGAVPHPADHRRGHPECVHRLQTHHDQAIS